MRLGSMGLETWWADLGLHDGEVGLVTTAYEQAETLTRMVSRLEALASLGLQSEIQGLHLGLARFARGIRQALNGECPTLLTPGGCPLAARKKEA